MDWLNYHHLLYFWTVVREGGIGPAAARLRLSPQTISGQVKTLEEALGEPLFEKRGRRLALTEVGRLAYGYADDIFALGRELVHAVKGRPTGRPRRLAVGIAEVVPKLVASRLLEPALDASLGPVHLVCREDRTERLLIDLASHRLDAVVLDVPLGAGAAAGGHAIRAFNHLLGECGVTFFAKKAEARRLAPGFPRSLDGHPMLLPTEEAAVRRALDQWLRAHEVAPRIVGEFDDSALLKVFGQHGHGVFAGPSAIADEIVAQYDVVPFGEAPEVRERFYVVTMQRKLDHPAVKAITERARRELFGAKRS